MSCPLHDRRLVLFWLVSALFCANGMRHGAIQALAADDAPAPGATIIAAGALGPIQTHSTQPPIHTAAESLQRFLKDQWHCETISLVDRPADEEKLAPGTILLGTPTDTPALARWAKDGRLTIDEATPAGDAYELAVVDGCVVVNGASARAVLYGVYELQDVIMEHGGVSADLRRRAAPALRLRLLHPRVRGGFDAYRRSDFEFLARCGGNVAHLSHDWMGEKTLFQFVPCPDFPRAVDAQYLESRRKHLRQYLDWCNEYGLDAALWLCEIPCQGGPWTPEAARQAYLEHFPAECLSETGTYQGKVLCLAHPTVERAYRRMARQFFTDFPEIKLMLVFTLDSNGELCDPARCPRHQGVSKLTQYNRLLTLLQEEGRAVRADVHVVSIGWGWTFRGDPAYLAQQAALPAGMGLTSPPDGEAWSFDRKRTDALAAYRDTTRQHGQLFLGYDIFLWGDDTVMPQTNLYDFPLGVAQKLRRWNALGVDGVFDQWGTQAEYVQGNAVALRELTFHPEWAELGNIDAWAESLAVRRFGRAAAADVLAAWREIEAAQQIQSDHAYYWHHLRPSWAGPTLDCPLTVDALLKVELRGGEPPKPCGALDYAPLRDDIARAKALGPALTQAADHFQQALTHLQRALDTVPADQRSALDHWYAPEQGAPARLSSRQLLEEQITAVRLHAKTQRRMGRFFTAFALVKSLPSADASGHAEAVTQLRQLEAADHAAE
jgi:hypothetical protein